MSLFVIGDTHLSLSTDKPMDIFGGWKNYMQRLEENWRSVVQPQDTVIIPGDVSWGMSLEQAKEDFLFLHRLPGKKILMKGNHDYWWTTRAKMESFLEENGLVSLSILHNNAVSVEGLSLCGSRGWMFEQGQEHDKKIINREAGRIRASLQDAQRFGEQEKVLFLHYPPVFMQDSIPEFFEVMNQYGVRRCYYGHIHSQGCRFAFQGEWCGVQLEMVSADYLRFMPMKIG